MNMDGQNWVVNAHRIFTINSLILRVCMNDDQFPHKSALLII